MRAVPGGDRRRAAPQVTLDQAIALRRKYLQYAQVMAYRAANTTLRWGDRYEAAVLGDHCLDIAKEADAYIRERAGV